MLVKEDILYQKKPYERPEAEITVFKAEKVCCESGVTGDMFGMDGTYLE